MALLDIHEAAAVLRIHPNTLRRLARTGKVPAMRIGRGGPFRFDADALTPRTDLRPSAPARGDYDNHARID